MKYIDVVEKIAEETNMPKNAIDKVLRTFRDVVIDAVAEGEKFNFPGFASFYSQTRGARDVREPINGKMIHVPEKVVPKVRPLSDFRTRVAKED